MPVGKTPNRSVANLFAVCVLIGHAFVLPVHAEDVVVDFGSAMVFLANSADPGLGTSWIAPGFDDSGWQAGIYGVGYETSSPPAAENLLLTTVPSGTSSVFTRTTFNITDVTLIQNLFLGCDFDDGYIAWINGVEVFRSLTMPAGPPAWNSTPFTHESSHGLVPTYEYVDISSGIAALQTGTNTLATSFRARARPPIRDKEESHALELLHDCFAP